jgi:membrane-bound ClpP family serine protease
MRVSVPSALRLLAAVLAGSLFSARPAPAQNAEQGLFVTVRPPLTTESVNYIKAQVDPKRNREVRPVKIVVFDFNPDGKDVTSTDFGAAAELARYIAAIKGSTTTVAFVHGKVSGHAVLPVLACRELVMSGGKETKVGEVAAENVPPLKPFEREAYREYFANDTLWPVVQKMFDPDVQLARGKVLPGLTAVKYVDRRNAAELKTVGAVENLDFAPPGQLGSYSADEMKKLGLVKATAESRAEVADLYDIRDIEDVLAGRTPDAYQFTLKGKVDNAMRESVNRVIRDVKRKKGNTLILTLNCGGGDLEAARALAEDIVKAQSGDDPLQIIGFIPDAAPDTATFLALACTELVMSKRKDAAKGEDQPKEADLGDFEQMIQEAERTRRTAALEAHRKVLKDFAEQRGLQGKSILIDGLFDKNLEILRVQRVGNRTQRKLMSAAEYEADGGKNWEKDKAIKPKGLLLKLTATQAAELGIAKYTVDNRTPSEVYAIYGLPADKVKEATPGWLDQFAEFLRLPVVTVLLVVIGFTGLILELKVPGLTVPGIIAALCFIMVFWAQSQFRGEVFVLALLLFVLGLVLIGLEIFVLPGFGAPGIFGVLCMLAGLGLVTFDKVPQTGDEWAGLGMKVSHYLFAMIGAFALAFAIARFLPKVPYANRLMLAPPADNAVSPAALLPGASEAAELLGAVGTANTALRPAGVVRFGDKFVDVVSDGAFVAAGTRVQVVAVEGTRIVVKEV